MIPLRIDAGHVGPTLPAGPAADGILGELFAGLVSAAAPDTAVAGSSDARPQRTAEEPVDPLLLLLQGAEASAPAVPTTLVAIAAAAPTDTMTGAPRAESISPTAPELPNMSGAHAHPQRPDEGPVDPLLLLQGGQAGGPIAPSPPTETSPAPRRLGAVRPLAAPVEQRIGGAAPARLFAPAAASPQTADAALADRNRTAAVPPPRRAPVLARAVAKEPAGPVTPPSAVAAPGQPQSPTSPRSASPAAAPVQAAAQVAAVVQQPIAAAPSTALPQAPVAATATDAAGASRTAPAGAQPPAVASDAAPAAKTPEPRTIAKDPATASAPAEWAPVLAALEEIRSRMQPVASTVATPAVPEPKSSADPAPTVAASNVPDLLARVVARFGGGARTPAVAPAKAAAPLAPAAVPAHNLLDPAALAAMPASLIDQAPAAEPLQALTEAPAPLAEQAVERQLDLAHEGEWLDALARDIARTGSGDAPLRFRLHPEYLGTLDVEVRQTADGATVRMTAETAEARAIIADAQPKLVAEARAQGVRIAEAHVDLGQQHAGGHSADSRGRQPDAQPRPGRPDPQASTPEPHAARSADLYA